MSARKASSKKGERANRAPARSSGGTTFLAVVVAVLDGPRAQLRLTNGRLVDGLLPMHVNQAWLAAAVLVAPVEATVLQQGERHFVSGLFPGPEHAEVSAEVRLEGTKIVLRAGKAQVELVDDDVRVRGDEIHSRATGEHWVLGARVRIN